MTKALQLVAFDVPDPPDYGGAIDVYYKIKALVDAGVEVHFHCFDYGRGPSPRLEALCASVKYYPRRRSPLKFLDSRPFIVATRDDPDLVKALSQRNDPIWVEGLHGGAILEATELKDYPRFVRTHNVEHHYYRSLADVSPSPFQRFYLRREAQKLEAYEAILSRAQGLFPLSQADTRYFQKQFSAVTYLPVFQSMTEVHIPKGVGTYVLYHGNLAVGENDQAARYLVSEVFSALDIPLVIAGRRPSLRLKREAADYSHVRLVEPETVAAMDQWIQDAQIHILPTFQATGLKLKLLKALFQGRHVLVNDAMLTDPELRNACSVFASPEEAQKLIKSRFQVPVPPKEIQARQQLLETVYNPHTNAAKIIRQIFV